MAWGLSAMAAGGVMTAAGLIGGSPAVGAVGLFITLTIGILNSIFLRRSMKIDPQAAAMQFAPAGCWAWRLDDGTIWSDEDFRRLAGVEDAESFKDFADLLGRVHPEDLSMVHAAIDKTIEHGTSLDLQVRLRSDEGLWRPLRFLGGVPAPGNPDACIRGFALDDTHDAAAVSLAEGTGEELVRALSELARSNADLETVRIDLEQRNHELELARSAAVDATTSKSQFLANMSHEIRTPLGAIIGHAELLVDEGEAIDDVAPKTGRRREFVETIHRNGEHLLALVSEILDLSKIEAGHMQIERVPDDPRRLIEDASRLLAGQADARGLAMAVEIDSQVPETVSLDPVRCRQILINLVGNAIKFTEHGGIRIKLGYETGRNELRMVITDTGIGMDSGALNRIFQPFRQADGSMTRRFGGTGLGLSISRHLCRLMGGDLTVESRRGHGSTFKASFKAPIATRSRLQTSGTTIPSDLRILLAEDGPDNRRLVSHLLGRLGAEVETVENGREAVDRLLHGGAAIDLVLMDMQMPVMDGWEATRRLRNAGCGVPVLALTANAMPGDRAACLEAGCDAYLAKPVRREALAAAISTILAESDSERRAG